MEAFLRNVLPSILGTQATFDLQPFQGKQDLIDKLPSRLRAYSKWLPQNHRIVVVVDRDDDDCSTLKRQMERIAVAARLRTPSKRGRSHWQVANRIAIEELEAWCFGDWEAVCAVYPRVPRTIPERAGFRDPDNIAGTWEAFERILKTAGYFTTGLRKIEAAREVGARIVAQRNRSRSFQSFREIVSNAVAES